MSWYQDFDLNFQPVSVKKTSMWEIMAESCYMA